MAGAIAQTVKARVDKVENLVVDGGTATADVTLVASTAGKMSYTSDASPITLVKEDGRWKDITPPTSNNEAYLTVGRSGLDTS
jgi:hypothetical protein